ncbi:hypothetical protein TNCV_3872291 [Trichonephila clavipes]|nr:hypothetical protein TNCV_3872291 [Trichonephila clavipes]
MLTHPIVFLLLTSSYAIGPSRTGHTPSTTEPGTTAQGTLRSRYGMEESVQVPVPKIKVGSVGRHNNSGQDSNLRISRKLPISETTPKIAPPLQITIHAIRRILSLGQERSYRRINDKGTRATGTPTYESKKGVQVKAPPKRISRKGNGGSSFTLELELVTRR